MNRVAFVVYALGDLPSRNDFIFGVFVTLCFSLRREGNVLIHLPIICASYLPYELLWPHGVIFVIF